MFDVDSKRALTLGSLTPAAAFGGAAYNLYLHPALSYFPYEIMRTSSSILQFLEFFVVVHFKVSFNLMGNQINQSKHQEMGFTPVTKVLQSNKGT